MFTPALEGYVFQNEDIGFRVTKDDIGKHKVILITGHSGSGKTTLARGLCERYGYTLIELDWFDNFAEYPLEILDPRYTGWKLFTDCIVEANNGKPVKTIELGHVARLSLMSRTWTIFMDKIKKDKKQYAVEGIQVVTLMSATKVPFTLPVIIKGTSAISSALRRKSRDGKIWMGSRSYCMLEVVVLWMGQERFYQVFMSRQLAISKPTFFGLDYNPMMDATPVPVPT